MNVTANIPCILIAKTAISFALAGITSSNTAIIYEIGSPNKSYVPGRSINPVTAFQINKGYYLIPIQDINLSSYTYPPFNVLNTITQGALIVCDGNSLTAGGYGGLSYPALLAAYSPLDTNGAQVINKGVGGQTTAQMIADATTDIDSLYDADRTCILIAWEMGNDLYFNDDVPGAQTRFAAYCSARKAVGWKVIAITCTPRESFTGSTQTTYETKLQQLNTWLLANYSTFADAVVNARADARLQAVDLAYWNVDRIHLKQAGNEILLTGIIDAIKTL